MHKALLIFFLLASIFADWGWSADQWSDVLGVVDQQHVVADPEPWETCSPTVGSVTQNSLAQKVGIKPGDSIVSVNGLRVFGKGEYDLVRFCYLKDMSPMSLVILREGKLVSITAEKPNPGNKLGFEMALDRKRYREALMNAGFPAAPEGVDWADFPIRAGFEVIRFAKKNVDKKTESAWISRLATCYAHLVNQEYAEAGALKIRVPAQAAELQRLERFYSSFCEWHREGDRDPDLSWHGESLLWYVIHRPYPRLMLPDLGTFTHPNPAFMKRLKMLRADPHGYLNGSAPEGLVVMEELGVKDFESKMDYEIGLQMAILSPKGYGGWPFRHVDLKDATARSSLMGTFRKKIDQAGGDSDWGRFGLAMVTYADAVKMNRPEPIKEAIVILTPVRQTSPFLACVGLVTLASSADHFKDDAARTPLQECFASWPTVQSNPPCRLITYLRARETSFAWYRWSRDGGDWNNRLPLIYQALSRKEVAATSQGANDF